MATTIRKPSDLKNVDPRLLERNPENPRIFFRQEEMEALLTSINELGIQVPLTVYKEGSKFRLIDGERRWRCAIKLNLPSVPVIVQDKPTELENLLLAWDEAKRKKWIQGSAGSLALKIDELVGCSKCSGARVELAGARLYVRNYRNPGHHRPKTKKAAVERNKLCKLGFQNGVPLLADLHSGLRRIGLSGRV